MRSALHQGSSRPTSHFPLPWAQTRAGAVQTQGTGGQKGEKAIRELPSSWDRGTKTLLLECTLGCILRDRREESTMVVALPPPTLAFSTTSAYHITD